MKDKKLTDLTVGDVGKFIGKVLLGCVALGILLALLTEISC